MGKTTYLFGAGASCLCLPLVEDIPESLLDFHTLLTDNIPGESKYENIYNQMLQDLEVLIQNAKTHSSIDTYAKKLFIIHEGNPSPPLTKLKFLLSFCFVYEQTRYPPDPRYDTFFASILNDSAFSFSGDIRIVSWNYDYQFEKAHYLYTGEKSMIETQRQLPVFPNKENKGFDPTKFAIYKINGTTAFYDPESGHSNNIVNDLSYGVPYHIDKLDKGTRRKPGVLPKETCQKLVNDFLDLYSRAFSPSETVLPLLNFAWESTKKGNTNTVLSLAKSAIMGSSILVIIGYSFPFFNRNIDKQIINSLTTDRKIYIQSTKFEDVASNLESIAPIDHKTLIQVKNIDQFYLPGEL